VGKIADENVSVSTVIKRRIATEIDRYRRPARMTRSAYVAAILEDWERRQCPFVTDTDKAMRLLASMDRKMQHSIQHSAETPTPSIPPAAEITEKPVKEIVYSPPKPKKKAG